MGAVLCQREPLHDMLPSARWHADLVRGAVVPEVRRIYHECVSFPTADGVTRNKTLAGIWVHAAIHIDRSHLIEPFAAEYDHLVLLAEIDLHQVQAG